MVSLLKEQLQKERTLHPPPPRGKETALVEAPAARVTLRNEVEEEEDPQLEHRRSSPAPPASLVSLVPPIPPIPLHTTDPLTASYRLMGLRHPIAALSAEEALAAVPTLSELAREISASAPRNAYSREAWTAVLRNYRISDKRVVLLDTQSLLRTISLRWVKLGCGIIDAANAVTATSGDSQAGAHLSSY